MGSKKQHVTKHHLVTNQAEQINVDLKYLTKRKAEQLLQMFDSPEAYAENFSALKAITRGLFKLILETNPDKNSQIGRMFRTVNDLQGILMLEDMHEHERILKESGLMPDVWNGFTSTKGGTSCA